MLVPRFGLTGAALALAASNGAAFLYRSVTGQMYYRTVASYPKTISGFLLAFAVTAVGTLLWQHFFIKFALVGVILFIYCTLYRAQLARLWTMGLGILRGIFHKRWREIMKHCGTQELETQRLVLRRLSMDDSEMMYNNWASDKQVTQYLRWNAHHSWVRPPRR